MSGWQYIGGHSVAQVALAGRVGHVVHRTDGEYVALLDGCVLGIENTETEARALVEDAAVPRRATA